MGKRVDFSGRTVITPSDVIHPGEVGVPVSMSKILTIPVTVTDYNKKTLQDVFDFIFKQLDDWLDDMQVKFLERAQEMPGVTKNDYKININSINFMHLLS